MIIYHVRLNENSGFQCQFLFLLNIVGHVAELLLHHSDGLKISRVVEGIATQ